MWSRPDVIGLFSNNLVSFSRNLVLGGLSFSINSVPKPRMLSVRGDYVLSSLHLGSILIVSSGFAGELGALCSAAKNFVSAAKTQEGILITYPTASEFAASTIAYAAAKERYFSEFRAAFRLLDGEEKQRVAKAT